MSIASEITRLQTAKADLKAAIEAKGVTVSSAATLDDYDSYVSAIYGGGGSGLDFSYLNYSASDESSANTILNDCIDYSEQYTGRTTNFTNNRFLTFAPSLGSLLSGTTNFSKWFQGCWCLIYVPLFDTSSGTNFSQMFDTCTNLRMVPLFDTSRGTNFNQMFANCESITGTPQFDTSSGTTFTSMFSGCDNLKNIPEIDTSRGTNLNTMFANCVNITQAPSFNVSAATTINNMFYYCTKLVTIGRFSNCEMITNTNQVFDGCTKLENFGGFYGLKASLSIPNTVKLLTVQSLNNIIDGLYDFTAAGETPTSSQGVLSLNSTNFAKLSAAEIAVGTAKGWTIQA